MVEKGLGRESDDVIVGITAEGRKRFIVQIIIKRIMHEPEIQKYKNGFDHEAIYKVTNSRLGWYRRSGMSVVNFILSPDLLENKIKNGAGLLNPLNYYLRNVGI